jgi:hypothetical protein
MLIGLAMTFTRIVLLGSLECAGVNFPCKQRPAIGLALWLHQLQQKLPYLQQSRLLENHHFQSTPIHSRRIRYVLNIPSLRPSSLTSRPPPPRSPPPQSPRHHPTPLCRSAWIQARLQTLLVAAVFSPVESRVAGLRLLSPLCPHLNSDSASLASQRRFNPRTSAAVLQVHLHESFSAQSSLLFLMPHAVFTATTLTILLTLPLSLAAAFPARRG